MSGGESNGQVQLWLADRPDTIRNTAPWIGPLVALGGMVYRYARADPDRQLIVALSAPRRDFAAALIGCGWTLATEAPPDIDPLRVLSDCHRGQPVRVVTDHYVMLDRFDSLRVNSGHPEVKLDNSRWQVPSVRSASKVSDLDRPIRQARPKPSALAQWAGQQEGWDHRLAVSRADLAIIGTRKWLETDVATLVGIEGGDEHGSRSRSTIADTLIPRTEESATWFTEIVPSFSLGDLLPLGTTFRAALLDGTGPIKYVTEIETPVVVCVLDRSVADEISAELVVQLRNSRGEPFSLAEQIGWRGLPGIEAMAFTVPL